MSRRSKPPSAGRPDQPLSRNSLEGPLESASRRELIEAARGAHHYFIERLTKREIGGLLALSRLKVADLLDLARRSGMVRIAFDAPLDVDVAAGEAVNKAYGLSWVLVAERRWRSETELLGDLDGLTATILSGEAHTGVPVGISWGRSVNATVEAIPVLPACPVVQVAVLRSGLCSRLVTDKVVAGGLMAC